MSVCDEWQRAVQASITYREGYLRVYKERAKEYREDAERLRKRGVHEMSMCHLYEELAIANDELAAVVEENLALRKAIDEGRKVSR
jgi:hypothetical protein